MAKITSKLNLRGIREITTSVAMQSEINKVGERLALRAGDGFVYREGQPSTRTRRGYVRTNSIKAIRQQMKNAVLERAIAAKVEL